MDTSFQIVHCSWQDNSEALTIVRRIVFIEEQNVPEALELDESDPLCHHVLATGAQGKPIATGRIAPDGRIGRMAVLKTYRGQGIGSTLLAALLEYARSERYTGIYLHAQLTAIPFYQTHGFIASGDVFMDAGIEHQNMLYQKQGSDPSFR